MCGTSARGNTTRARDVPPVSRCYLLHVGAKVRLRGLVGAVAVASLVAACGSKRPPPSAGGGAFSEPSPGGGLGGDAGARKPPGCGQKDDGSYCDCIDVPLFTDPPNMYFVLDRSGSMAEGDKWDQVRQQVANVMRALGPRASFGATVFPGFAQEACAPPLEVLSTRLGDSPSDASEPTTTAMLQATAGAPSGGTPTADALRFVLPIASKLAGKTFVVLATDGGPNCNRNAACGYDKCMPNIEDQPGCPVEGPANCCEPPAGYPESCLDGDATTAAVSSLKAAGFPVYVIGIPGTERYASLLDALATAGGTAQTGSPKYFRVDSTSSDALLGTLRKVAAKIVATCEFRLKSAPSDPNTVNVYLDEVVVPKDPTNGWKIDGGVVTLLGDTCQRVLRGDALDVRIITGCPTVEPR